MMDIKEISKRNYKATVKRGLISDKTTFQDFISKLDEEVSELDMSELPFNSYADIYFDERELADVALVCFAMAEFYHIDLLRLMEAKTMYNENRKD